MIPLQERIIQAVIEERRSQDLLWGGPANDDQHTPAVWIALLVRHLGLAVNDGRSGIDPTRYRKQLIRVAALALAAVESHDRISGYEQVFNMTERGPGY